MRTKCFGNAPLDDPPPAPLRVLIVDDSSPFRSAVCAYVRSFAQVRIVGEAADGRQAVGLQERLRPDLVLMDMHMPVMNGLEATERMKAAESRPMVVLVSVRSDQYAREAALRAGADEFFTKSDLDAELQRVLALAFAMRAQVSPTEGIEMNIKQTPDAAVSNHDRAVGTADRRSSDEALALYAREDRLRTCALLSAGLAHEVANPLMTLTLMLRETREQLTLLRANDGLLSESIVATLSDHLDGAQLATQSIVNVVKDYGVFMRGEAGDPSESSEPEDAVRRAVRMARPRTRNVAALRVLTSTTQNVPGSGTWITQVLLNLMINAIEALPPESVATNTIEVQLWQEAQTVIIEVRDNGPGLDQHRLRGLFEPMVSAKDSVGTQGLGLGLSISRALAHRHGGDLVALPRTERGSVFRLTIAAAPPTGLRA